MDEATSDVYLSLLASAGIVVGRDEWNACHGATAPPVEPIDDPCDGHPTFPFRPVDWIDDVPCFSRRQFDTCDPETLGYDVYFVKEISEADARACVPTWEQEAAWRRFKRPPHRYSRLYRLRRTLAYSIGAAGDLPPGHERIRLPAKIRTSRRHIYNHVRKQLRDLFKGTHRASRYYASIPYLIATLTNRRWHVSTGQWSAIMADAGRLHYAFDRLVKAGRLKRRRFPKMQFVVLKLMQRHKVVPPYHVPWARTSIKRRQLATLTGSLDNAVETPPCP